MSEYRMEHDTMGEVRVPAEHFWGAQTQRSYENFAIGTETMPEEIIRAFAVLKYAAADTNCRLGKLSEPKRDAVVAACQDILDGRYPDEFPLKVWQTGSGTQSNMNVNEVIAHIAAQDRTFRQGSGHSAGEGAVNTRDSAMVSGNDLPAGGSAAEHLSSTETKIISGVQLHPNDDVNMSQSSNDTFPTAMHIAALTSIRRQLLPAMEELIQTFRRLEEENSDVIKIGRTHLQDAVPLRFSQEISGWRYMIQENVRMLEEACGHLKYLAIGGTAVGTGLNCPAGFSAACALRISELTGEEFESAENKFHALTSKDACVFTSGALKALAANLMKIANDVRWLAGGPRCGLGEIHIPENEPGSSIMPGKVNPTQCEAMTMIAVQVMGNDAAIGLAASQGNFELNVFMPVIAYNLQQSIRLLSDGIRSFSRNCLSGLTADRGRMEANVNRSLMLVTCLTPEIGYENAAKAAKKAHAEGTTLKEAVTALGFMSAEDYDEKVRPENMV